MTATEETADMSRPYTRVTAEMEARVIAAREMLGAVSYTDIAAMADVPERTVKYVLVDLPRLRRLHNGDDKAEKSLRSRIMVVVKDLGQVKDVAELRRVLGMADDEHNVVHVLHALHGAGKIDFTERGNGMGTATVINIRLPKRGKKTEPLPVVSRQEEEQAISAAHNPLRLDNLDGTSGIEVTDMAAEPEATAPLASAPGPESEGYPLLTELLSRERDRSDADQKALAYIAAAAALEHTDPEMARVLTTKVDEHYVTYPSPLELEYLRYAEDHPE